MKLAEVPLPAEKEFVVVWQSPDYRELDRPAYRHDWDALLEQAGKALAARRATYPAWIAGGQIEHAAADQDIQAWEWLVQEWRWVITGEGEPPPHGSLRHRKAAIDLSIERIEAQLARGNRTQDMFRQAHLAMAFAWHLGRLEAGVPAIHWIARSDHARRREREAASSQQERSAA